MPDVILLAAVMYLGPVVIATVNLSDSTLTGIVSWLWGLEGVPDAWTLVGGAVILSGIGTFTWLAFFLDFLSSSPALCSCGIFVVFI